MRDIRDAIRAFRAAPGFTAIALIVLTLGIGATTAIYSVVDAVVLRDLPFDHPDRLVALSETFNGKLGAGGVAPQEFLDWKGRQDVFESIAATTSAREAFRLQDGDRSYKGLRVTRVTADLFAVLHASPQLGRVFSRENEIEGSEHVAVLSHEFWRRQFGADPSIVGRTMRLTNGSWEIVGVMPPGFRYPVGTTPMDLWVPYAMSASETVRRNVNLHNTYLRVVARLRSGVTVDGAQARMDGVMNDLARESPTWFTSVRLVVQPWKEAVVAGNIRSWLLLLLGAVSCVLLIACVNVANLLLARAAVRSREIGIRAAVGANRWQIVRGLLVESLLLASAGTALGVVLAYGGLEVLRTALPPGIPRIDLIAVNVRVLLVAALTAVTTGLAFGVLPSLQGSDVNLVDALRQGGRTETASRSRLQLRAALLVGEVSLAVVLLVGAGLFISSFERLMRIDVGLDYHHVVAGGVYPDADIPAKTRGLPEMARAAAVLGEIVERVRALPGIEAASVFDGGLPLSDMQYAQRVTVPGAELPRGSDLIDVHRVTPDYPKTLRVPLLGGRLLTDSDNRTNAVPVALLNDVAARRFLGGREPLGATIGVEGDRTVVGVVGSVRTGGPETEAWPEVYIPLAQGGVRSGFLMIRTGQDVRSLQASVAAIVAQVAPDARIGEFEALDDIFGRLIAQRRFNMLVLGLFGVLAITISSIGIYGVVSHLVQQRTKEIGVRMALGAEPWRILNTVLGRSALAVGFGVGIGLIGAWTFSRLAAAFLFEIHPHDLTVYIAVSVLVAAVGLVAAAVPARRAANVDPVVALRTD